MRRVLLVVAVVLVGVLGLTVAAVAGAGGRGSAGSGAVGPALLPAAASIVHEPALGATDVSPIAPATVSVVDGTLDAVTLTGPDGSAVEGALGADGTSWSSAGDLAYDTTYTWAGSATGPDGAAVPVDGSFTTLAPSDVVRGVLNIGDDRTVGIAAPIEIQFDAHVEDRAAVERALSVETSVPVEGSWGWLPDENGGSRVHWRPAEYWPAHTDVTVTADLFGVAYGGGAYGRADVTSTFTIGRAQVVKADVNSHRMLVIRDGRQVADYPASYGLSGDADRTTRSGVHVVSERFTDKRMVSERYGYDLVEKWAVRISNNGEFIHANPASASAQGSSNVTHGCVNLSTADAQAYYDTAIYGDPVEVTGTDVPLASRDGDIWDWTLSYDQWQQLSAL
ncbi:L,D-transpeptidase [Pseudonocardia abyssalis]|uniref:L,D-transpeptidase family protein n=1 Tax=Pseudonocardia abyssalis TaxID=2792008 RepID=A0ABS6UYH1_9PSEU|nr:Ig-like domain-containing protein [Pseudonocardia abyssalis]MBW0115194.1 L,D-transpeptidase family protein [Pseudonocardia abyssalis]MBW0136769.1 L,D-transpeptidase family protein [Pseudonocardia abyssalis]